MTRLAQTLGLTEIQTEILANVRSFVDKQIIPAAQELEHDVGRAVLRRAHVVDLAHGGVACDVDAGDEAGEVHDLA